MKYLLTLLYLLNAPAFFLFAQGTVGGQLTSNDTLICGVTNSGVLTLNAHSGNILRWEYSSSGGDPWTPVIHTSSTYNFTNLSQSLHFRVIVQAPGYLPAASNSLLVKIAETSKSGIITGENNYCENAGGLLKLINQQGEIQEWEYSLNNGLSWITVANSTDSNQLYRSFSENRLYRVSVKNSVCPSELTAPFPVTVHAPTAGGTISGTDSLCSGINAVQLSLTGAAGNSYIWESSAFEYGPWINTSVDNLLFQQNNVSQSQFYRVKVSNQYCPDSYSNTHKLIVSSPSSGGSISGIENICENKSVALHLSNYTGKITEWETSTDQTSWLPVANTEEGFTTSSLGVTSYFRVQVKNGRCPAVYSTVKTINVESLPATDFSFSNQCRNSNIAFQNTTPGANNYEWFFGDGTSEHVKNPSHRYELSGTYTVTLKATSFNGCTDSVTRNIQVYPVPVINFSTADTLCFGDDIQFTNLSTISGGSIVTYSWSFGQNGASALEHPVFSQFVTGSNTIKLKGTSNFGCADSVIKTIILRDKPVPQFEAANNCFGTPTFFYNQSFSGASSAGYSWNFGDGTQSSAIAPQHTYSGSGAYSVILKATTTFGCTDSILKQVYIKPQPVIDFTFNDNCFSDTSFFHIQVDSVSQFTVQWLFENGITSGLLNPSHVFSNYGQYPVKLKVISDSNCVQEQIKTIQIYPKPVADFLVQNTCQGDSVSFTSLSSIPYGTFQNHWNFGNGTTAQQLSPKTYYDSSAIYYPQLIAVSDRGCSDTVLKLLVTFDRPEAAFDFQSECYGIPIEFHNTSMVNYGIIDSYLWNFGDNTNSTLPDPVKEYLNEGTYSVSLIAVSSNGCKDTVVQDVFVYEAPVANFEVLNACDGQELTFNNTTVLTAGMFYTTWDFGDGNSSAEYAPAYLYSEAGIYVVTQKIKSDQGCTDSISKPVVVYPLPLVKIKQDTIVINKGESIQLTAAGAQEYTWYPSTAMDNPTVYNPVITPQESIIYFVSGTDNYHCINTDSVFIRVNNDYYIKPYNFITPDGNGKNEIWIIENILSYPDNTINIYDEMGHEVFSRKAYDNTWDGKNKTGELLPDGMYYYIISFDNSKRKYTGSVLLIRNK